MEWITQNLPYILAGISVGGQYALIAIGYDLCKHCRTYVYCHTACFDIYGDSGCCY